MKQKVTIIVVMFLLITSIFAMSNDSVDEPTVLKKEIEQTSEVADASENNDKSSKTATIAELEGYVLKNVWLDQEKKIDVSKYNEIKKNYLDRAKKLGKIDAEYFWKNRVNLDAYEQLKEDKAISERWEAEFRTTEDKILLSQVIVIGEVVSKEYDERKRAHYKTSCNVRVAEVLYNNYYISEVPDELIVKTVGDLRKSYANHEPNLKIGRKYILFLTKNGMERRAEYNRKFNGASQKRIDAQVEPLSNDVNNPNVFACVAYTSSDYELYLKVLSIEDMKSKIKKIEKLGGKSGFFQKTYK